MTAADPLASLVAGVLERRPRAVARAISAVEDGGEPQRELVRRLHGAPAGRAWSASPARPGPARAPSSTGWRALFRGRGETVGILAVDPTSPFTGGAMLGDRIRMQALYTDPGVFIRSMATRGAMGGLAPATRDAVDVLDAAGFDWVLVETVGVGQDEVDVVRSVDTVVVVTLPGLGDDIQAIKAGIMEIADVFVINKADKEGAERTARELKLAMELDEEAERGWMPPIVRTVASIGEGVEEVAEAVARHRAHLESSGELAERRRAQLRLRVEMILKQRVLAAADRRLDLEGEIERAAAQRLDPYTVADALFAGVTRLEPERTRGAGGGAPRPPRGDEGPGSRG